MTQMHCTPTITNKHRDVELSVIAPCYNEQDNIDALVNRTLATFQSMGIEGELILIDDSSSDSTWACIKHRSQLDARVRGVKHFINQGMVGGWRSGLQEANGEFVCLIDADLQNRPEDVAVLHRAYNKRSSDVIQAVRHPLDRNKMRRLCSDILNVFLNVVFGTKLRDNKSGFILCKRESLAVILKHRFRYRYYQCFIGVAACARGLTVGEVDTVFERRCFGQSFLADFPLKVIAKIVWEVFKFRVELLFEKQSQTTPIPAPPPALEPLSAMATRTAGGES